MINRPDPAFLSTRHERRVSGSLTGIASRLSGPVVLCLHSGRCPGSGADFLAILDDKIVKGFTSPGSAKRDRRIRGVRFISKTMSKRFD